MDHERNRQTDRQTGLFYGNTVLCTIVHREVKIIVHVSTYFLFLCNQILPNYGRPV